MDAGIPLHVHQQFASSDDTTVITLGPSGQVQMADSGGTLPLPSVPDVVPSDENQLSTTPDFPVTTAPITQISPSMPTSVNVPPTRDLQSYSMSEGFSSSPRSSLYLISTASLTSTKQASMVFTAGTSSSFPTSVLSTTKSLSSSSNSFLVSTLVSSSWISSTVSRSITSSLSATSSSISTFTITVASSSSSLSSSAASSSYSLSSSLVSYSSILASSTSSGQVPSETIVAPPLPAKASNLNVHNPPFYIGIALGTIVAIAILAALIAWLIRLQSHSKRRRSARTIVPWARSSDEGNGGLEAGHGGFELDNAAVGAMNLGSREDLAHVQAWSPRGDRDVGEPKRSESYVNRSTYSLHDHSIPGHTLFSDNSLGYGYPGSAVHPNGALRHLPSHLIDEDIAARAHQEDGSFYSNHYGRPMSLQSGVSPGLNPCYGPPRESAIKPRFLGLEGRGLDLPWNQNPGGPPPRSMVDRLRNLGKPPTEPPWEELGPLPTPGGHPSGRDEVEPWSSSFKTSLVNAFNAVAANLAGAPQMKEDDKLTAPPSRTSRKSIRDTVWEERGKGLSRDGSTSTINSKAWTLEETRDGAGIVRLHIADLQGYKHGSTPARPSMPGPALSFGDGESISTCDDRSADFHRVHTQESQIPLIASSRPQPALIRPQAYLTRRGSDDTFNGNVVSRNSSVYSSASTRAGVRTRQIAPELPRIPSRSDALQLPSFEGGHKVEDDSNLDSIVIEPDAISRLSSSDSSVGADGSLAGTRSAVDVAAARALKDRQKRVMEPGS
ncbi:hypothetical protein BDZ97DRAFT_1828401 [Flammula alnicola]|nr:hypothetical protein BDZ97DRAFT_1828401 [Flammula alnicola]